MTKKLYLIVAICAVASLNMMLFIVMFYTTQLSMSLVGPSKMEMNLCSVYEEQGVKAVFYGKDHSDKVKIKGEVDTSVPGTYIVTYRVGTLKMEREITVLDKMNPEIYLEPLPDGYKLLLGEAFEEPGYSAFDENGNDITADVKVECEIIRTGKNIIRYIAKDDEGNVTAVTRTVKVLPNIDHETSGVGICMYHYVYDENDPPEDLYHRFGNYISMQALEEELNWLNEEGYYYPTWEEVRAYVDGKLLLPDKSIVLCFDDGSKTFLEYGIPVLEKCKVPATCFMITTNNGEQKISKYKSDYVTYESHSHDMHRGGGNIGHGGIFTVISYEEGMADLKRSIKICDNSNAFAYPYGDYNDASRQMVEEAGFLCAVTTQPGKVYPGDDPMLLPRLRMSLGQSLESFQAKVQP